VRTTTLTHKQWLSKIVIWELIKLEKSRFCRKLLVAKIKNKKFYQNNFPWILQILAQLVWHKKGHLKQVVLQLESVKIVLRPINILDKAHCITQQRLALPCKITPFISMQESRVALSAFPGNQCQWRLVDSTKMHPCIWQAECSVELWAATLNHYNNNLNQLEALPQHNIIKTRKMAEISLAISRIIGQKHQVNQMLVKRLTSMLDSLLGIYQRGRSGSLAIIS